MSDATTPVNPNSNLAVAWEAYQASDEYKNSKHWAMLIAPMVQYGDPEADRKRSYGIASIDERERYIEGSLWAAFMAGFGAAGGDITNGYRQPTR